MSVTTSTTQAADPVAWLENDHLIIRKHLEELAVVPAAGRQATLDALKQILALHNAIEENLVYPALAKTAQYEPGAMELFHQTAEADVLLFTAQHALLHGDDATFTATIQTVTVAIREHINVEETQAFPRLQAVAPAERHELAQHIVAFKKSMTTPAVVN
jgi:hemerythrin-like domain-containing protein